MWYIYTMEYNSATKMNEIILFAATWMDLRDCHTEWSQRNIVWHPLYEESKKKWYKWTYLQNRNRLTDLGKGILRDFGMDMYTLLYLKWITRELCSKLCGSLDGREDRRRMDPCICMAESLSCSSETITTLLVSYTPNTK